MAIEAWEKGAQLCPLSNDWSVCIWYTYKVFLHNAYGLGYGDNMLKQTVLKCASGSAVQVVKRKKLLWIKEQLWLVVGVMVVTGVTNLCESLVGSYSFSAWDKVHLSLWENCQFKWFLTQIQSQILLYYVVAVSTHLSVAFQLIPSFAASVIWGIWMRLFNTDII